LGRSEGEVVASRSAGGWGVELHCFVE
jgi:hypothetical protein